VIEALDRGNRIEAIRLYRAAEHVGLRDAKDAIEKIENDRK
jgi:ribosomal protein L7/L12